LPGPLLAKAVDDNNASALDAALDACLLFADKGPCTEAVAQSLAPVIIARAFPGRLSNANKAEEVLLKFMEVGITNRCWYMASHGCHDASAPVSGGN
jgi:hypothetical protein